MDTTNAKRWMAVLAAAVLGGAAALAETETVDGVAWGYAVADGAATVTNASPARASLAIPAVLGGYPVEAVANNAFEGWGDLVEVSFPDGMKHIGGLSFCRCGLRNVEIPDSVESIAFGTFALCGAMTNATIGRGVTNIGSGAFIGCDALQSVHIRDLAAWCNIVHVDGNSNPLLRARRLFVDEKEVSGDLAIPEGVEKIALAAFYGCGNLTSVTFPDGVKAIGEYAFEHCDGLTNMVAGDNVKRIGTCAFRHCGALTDAAIGRGVTNLEGEIFAQCTALTNVLLPEGLKRVGSGVFAGCSALPGVALPEGLEEIGEGAFSGCTGLGAVEIPQGVRQIKAQAFKDCTALTNLVLSSSVTGIGAAAFSGCTALASLELPAGVKQIKEQLFQNCTALTNLVLPDGVATIGYDAFSGCSALRELTLPSKTARIGSGAFAGCDALEAVRIADLATWCGISFPDADTNPIRRVPVYAGGKEVTGDLVIPGGVARIGARAFCGCATLTSVSIPASVVGIGEDAFSECPALGAFSVAPGNAAFSAADGVLYDKDGTRLLQCPLGKTGAVDIPEGVADIADGAFANCAGVEAVSIPGSATNIGASAFYGCTGLGEALVPEGVANIGASAFYGCTGLREVSVPGSVADIGASAFAWCTGLVSAAMAEGVANIGNSAFERCGALESVSIPGSVTNIGSLAFGECVSLAELTLPAGLKSIGKSAFQGCMSVESVVIPLGVESIPNRAFYACCALKSATIPAGVSSIGSEAFAYCTELESAAIPDTVKSIGSWAFSECEALKSVFVPYGATSIGSKAFEGCQSLTAAVIPASVTSVGKNVFADCPALARVYLPSSWRGTSLETSVGAPANAIVYGDPPEDWAPPEDPDRPVPVEFEPGAGAWPEAGGDGLSVTLAAEPGAVIYYTLDGSRPVWRDAAGTVRWSGTAQQYSWPVRVRNGRDTGTKALSGIMTGKNENDAYDPWLAPAEPSLKIPVLRAAAIGADGCVGEVATATYLLGDAATRYGATPVVSLCAEWADLFDNTNGPGIYRYPTAADKAKVANAHVEFFDGGKRRFAKWCQLRAQGGTTLGRPKKSLRLTGWKGYAPDGKGKKEPFDWPFFGEAAGRRHASVVLRMGGNDWNRAILRDRLAQEICADEEVDGEAGAVCVLFLDGVYWGVHELRERHDAGFFKNRLGIGDADAFSLLEYGDSLDYPQVNEGWGEDDEARTSEAYADFWAILRQLEAWGDDLSGESRWAWFTNRVNADSLAAHFAASLFSGNSDWPWNNQQWWRAWPDGEAGAAVDRSRPRNDGRWNWTFHDMDFAFALPFDYVPDWSGGLLAAHDSWAGIAPGEGPYVGTWVEDASRAFRAAMTNPGFRQRFLARVYLRLATDWSPGACVAALERVAGELRAAGMDENGVRWRQPQTAADWERQIDAVRGYLRARPEAFAWHTRRRHGLGASRTVVLAADGEGAGSIRVAGREAVLPLEGGFPRDLPLELEAVPAKGSEFAGWYAVPGLLPEKSAARAEDCAANYGTEGRIFPSASLGTGWGPWTQEGGWVFISSSAMPIHGRSENGCSFAISDSDYGGDGAVRRELADGGVLAVGEEMSVDVGFGLAGGNGGAGVSFTAAGGAEEPVRLALAKDGPDGEAFRLVLDGREFIAENFPHWPGAPVRVALARTGETSYALRLERGGEIFGTDVLFSAEISGLRLWKNPYGDKDSKWTLWFDNPRVAAADAGTECEPLATGVLRPVAFYETGADALRWSRSVKNLASVWVETSPLCNIGTPAFGMDANEGSEASWQRRFGFALTNGYELSFDFQNNTLYVEAGASFLTESGESFAFLATGTNADYRLRLPGGEEIDTGVPLVKTGVHVAVAPREGGGVDVTVAGRTIALDAEAAIDGIKFFDRVGGVDKPYHVFFNRVAVRCDPGVPLPPPPPEPAFFETGADRANWEFRSRAGSAGGWAGGGAEDSRILGASAFYLYAGGPDPRDAEPFAEAVRMFPDELELGAGAVLSFRFAHGKIGDESVTGIGAVGWNLLDSEGGLAATFSAPRDGGQYLLNGDWLEVSSIPDTAHYAELRFASGTEFDLYLDGERLAEAVALGTPVRGLRFWNSKAGSGQERNLLFNDITVYLPVEKTVPEPAARRRAVPRDGEGTLLSAERIWTLVPSNDIAVVARFVPRGASDLDLWAAERGIADPWAADPDTGRSPVEDYLLETNAVDTLHDTAGGAYRLRFTPGEHGVDADIQVTDTLPGDSWRAPLPGELSPLDASGRRYGVSAPRLFLRLRLRPAD